MSYLPVRFPLKIGRDPSGGPEWSTTVNTTIVGDEQRNQNWVNSRHRYEVSNSIKRNTTDFKDVGDHFRMARGRLHHFRFRDWSDYVCARTEGRVSAITSTTFQLEKHYGAESGFVEERRISRPVSGSLSLWISGVLKTISTHYTVDVETGIITIGAAPDPADVETSFSFDVPCRYDTDRLNAVLRQFNAGDQSSWMSWDSVPIVEDRDR